MVKTGNDDKTDGFLTILFFLFTLYLATLGGIITVLREISSAVEIGLDRILINQIYGMILTGAAAFIFVYLIIIAAIGVLELKLYYSNLGKKQQLFRLALRKFVLGTPREIVFGMLPVGSFVLITLIYYFNSYFALFSSLLYLVLAILILLKGTKRYGNKINTSIHSIIVNTRKRSNGAIWLGIYAVIMILLTVFIVFSVIIFSLAKYDISLDKERYNTGDNVLITANPRGIVKPVTQGVFYSNAHLPIEYKRDSAFGGAPVYATLRAENLTDLPFNSYLSIQYVLPYTAFLRKNLTQEIFIPVFPVQNISEEHTNQTIYVNNTAIKNYYFN